MGRTLCQTKRDKKKESIRGKEGAGGRERREEERREEGDKGKMKGQGADGGGSFSKHRVKPWYCLAFSHGLDSSVKETVHPSVFSNLIITG